MKHLACSIRGIAALLAVLLTACACGEPSEPPASTWYADLAERSHPKAQGEGTMAAFKDLLLLRDEPAPGAAEILAQVVADHEGSTRIHKYAATQALSAIGTQRADDLLERCVARADFDGRQAFDYAFHWNMKPTDRDRYLRRFVLRDFGEAPALEVRVAEAAEDAKHWLDVEVVVRNDTDHELEIRKPTKYFGQMLVFRSAAGRVARTLYPATCEFMGARSITLAPGELRRVTIQVSRPEPVAEGAAKSWNVDPNGLTATAGGYHYFFAGAGRHEVMARWTSRRGRSVSAPVPVTLPAAR